MFDSMRLEVVKCQLLRKRKRLPATVTRKSSPDTRDARVRNITLNDIGPAGTTNNMQLFNKINAISANIQQKH